MIHLQDKPPLTVRLSVTGRCHLRCCYCMPAEGIELCSHNDILSFEEMATAIRLLQESFVVGKVRLTGGDPLARKGIVELVAMISDLGIEDLAMTTNAHALAGMAGDLRKAGLKRVNISFDSLDPDSFKRITRGGDLNKALKGIEKAALADLTPIKLNMVVMKGMNDNEVSDILFFAVRSGCELRFLELMPIGYGARLFDDHFVSSEEVRTRLSRDFDLFKLPRERSSSSQRYRVRLPDGTEGVAGFISPCTTPFCEACNRLRISSDGRILGCLAREEGVQIRDILRKGDAEVLADKVKCVMKQKRADISFNQPISMAAIGG